MTATPSIELPAWMAEQLSQASPDLLRSMIQTFAEALMSADADAVCGAGYGQRSPDRRNIRNGYRWRGWDTRTTGTLSPRCLAVCTRLRSSRPPDQTMPGCYSSRCRHCAESQRRSNRGAPSSPRSAPI